MSGHADDEEVRRAQEIEEVKKLLSELPDEDAPVSKTLAQLLAEGHPHKGGLAQLAAAEEAGTLFGSKEPPPEEKSTTAGLPALIDPNDPLERSLEQLTPAERWRLFENTPKAPSTTPPAPTRTKKR